MVAVVRGGSPFPISALTALLIALFAVALRIRLFGDPIAGVDEQFYLLVGDRMWAGAVPYVDIWDRKPAGLFLIYAACRALPGDGVLAYQIVATVCLAATGCVAAAITRRVASPFAALAAGLVVVLYGVLIGAGFGEAPVFYDLPIAGAAWLLVSRDDPGVRRGGVAMLLAGVAITIKPTAAFEGVAFGLYLLDGGRRAGVARSALAKRAAVAIAIGAAPMLAIAAWYVAADGFDAFWFANVESIFRKQGGTSRESVAALVACLIVLGPVAVPAIAGARGMAGAERRLMLAWLAASAAAFVAIGFFHFHYALPMVAPLAILAAAALGRWSAGVVVAAAGAFTLVSIVHDSGQRGRDRADVEALVTMIPASVRQDCLFVYEGPTILYHRTGACLPGRYVFPGHFTDPAEAGALERPSAEILRDTLARAPAAIVSVPRLREGGVATVNDRILVAALARDYRAVGARSVRLYGGRRVEAVVWVRNRWAIPAFAGMTSSSFYRKL